MPKEPCSSASNWNYTREIIKRIFIFDLFQLENSELLRICLCSFRVCFVCVLLVNFNSGSFFTLDLLHISNYNFNKFG